jgi:hypothetical protein
MISLEDFATAADLAAYKRYPEAFGDIAISKRSQLRAMDVLPGRDAIRQIRRQFQYDSGRNQERLERVTREAERTFANFKRSTDEADHAEFQRKMTLAKRYSAQLEIQNHLVALCNSAMANLYDQPASEAAEAGSSSTEAELAELDMLKSAAGITAPRDPSVAAAYHQRTDGTLGPAEADPRSKVPS